LSEGSVFAKPVDEYDDFDHIDEGGSIRGDESEAKRLDVDEDEWI